MNHDKAIRINVFEHFISLWVLSNCYLPLSFPKENPNYAYLILGGSLKGVRMTENSNIGTTKRWQFKKGFYLKVLYRQQRQDFDIWLLNKGGCLIGLAIFPHNTVKFKSSSLSLRTFIDPLHKWHLNLNNNTYTPKPQIHIKKNPLSGNMSTRLRLHKVYVIQI